MYEQYGGRIPFPSNQIRRCLADNDNGSPYKIQVRGKTKTKWFFINTEIVEKLAEMVNEMEEEYFRKEEEKKAEILAVFTGIKK